MSTRKELRTAGKGRQRSLFGGYHAAPSADDIQRDVMAAVAESDYSRLPGGVVSTMMKTDVFPELEYTHEDLGSKCRRTYTLEEIRGLVARALAAGFTQALIAYQQQLNGVPALASFYKRRAHGQRNGRETQSQRRSDRARQAMVMIKKGMSVQEVVSHFRSNGMPRCSKTTVHRWLKARPSKPRG